MTRQVWYRGDVITQHLDHRGRWASHKVRKALPTESEDQFPQLLRAPGGDQGLITFEKGEPGRKSQDLCSQSEPSVGSIPAVATTPTTTMTTTTPKPGSGSDNEHARLSPSSADRWTRCSGSILLESQNPDKLLMLAADKVRKLIPYLESLPPHEIKEHEHRAMKLSMDLYNGKTQIGFLKPQDRQDILRSEGSVASRSGVRAHDFAEAILNGRMTKEELPDEFRHTVGGYVDHCMALVPEGETPLVEAKVPLWYSPTENGTVDFAVVTSDRVIIRDYKNGAGKLVHHEANLQLGVYALSLVKDHEDSGLMTFEPDTLIDIRAYQPNHHEAADLKPWLITLKDLEDFCRPIEEAVEKIRAGEFEFQPSEEACCFCNLRGSCEARAAHLTQMLDHPNTGKSGLDLLALLPDDDEIPDMTKKEFKAAPVAERLTSRVEFATMGNVGTALDDETLVALWNKRSEISKFLDDVDEYLSARVLSGEKVEGLKIVYGRSGDRKWRNEEEAETFLKGQGLKQEQRFTFKLKSPPQIEEILAEKLKESKRTATRFGELIARSPAKKTIASISDSRDEVKSNIDELPDDSDEDGLGSEN